MNSWSHFCFLGPDEWFWGGRTVGPVLGTGLKVFVHGVKRAGQVVTRRKRQETTRQGNVISTFTNWEGRCKWGREREREELGRWMGGDVR
jgi:hypothetical protein